MKQREWQGKGLGPCRRVSGKNSITEREWGSREANTREDQEPEEREVRGVRHQMGTDNKVEQEEDKSSGTERKKTFQCCSRSTSLFF